MIDDLKRATDARGRHDAALLNLEAKWRHAVDQLAPDLPDDAADIHCRRIAELEAQIAVIVSHTALGVAAKLRLVRHYVMAAGEERPCWLQLLTSAIADLESACDAR